MTALLDLLPGARRAGATHGGEYSAPCPFCGGTDRFRAWPAHPSGRPRWWCRQCGRAGDMIDLLRERGLSYHEAARAAGHEVGKRQARTRGPHPEPSLRPPPAGWQARAEEVGQEAEAALWAPEGARALAYLRQRGFADETVRAARLGYMAADRREAPAAWGLAAECRPERRFVWVPRGVCIPWRALGATWRLNIRRPAGDPKYVQAGGGGKGLYGADALRLWPELPAVLVEGELDGLAIWQAAGDEVNAVATGSTSGARHPLWVALLAAAPVVLVAYDSDRAGDTAAQWWLERLPGARRLVPAGDPAAMLQAGEDLREWIRGALT